MPRVSEDRFRLLVLASLDRLPEWTRDAPELGLTVARVVRHELSHYFGIDDEELMDLGAY